MEFNLSPDFRNLAKIYPSDIDANLINNTVNLILSCLIIEKIRPNINIKTSNKLQGVPIYEVVTRNELRNDEIKIILGTSDLKALIETLNVFFVIDKTKNSFRISRRLQNYSVFILNADGIYTINPNYLIERRINDLILDVPIENLEIMIEVFNYFYTQTIARNTLSGRVENLILNSRALIARNATDTLEFLRNLVRQARKEDIIYESLEQLLEEAKNKGDIFKIELFDGLLNKYNEDELNKVEYDKLILSLKTASYLRFVIRDLSDELKFRLWKFIKFNNLNYDPEVKNILDDIEQSLRTHEIRLNENESYILIPSEIILTPSINQEPIDFAARALAIANKRAIKKQRAKRKVQRNFNNIVQDEEEGEEEYFSVEEIDEEEEYFSVEEIEDEYFDVEGTEDDYKILIQSILFASKGYGNFRDPTDPSNIILNNIFGGIHDVFDPNVFNPNPANNIIEDVDNPLFGGVEIAGAFGALNTRNMAWAISLLVLTMTAVMSYWVWAYNRVDKEGIIDESPYEYKESGFSTIIYNTREKISERFNNMYTNAWPGYGSPPLPSDIIMSEVQRAKILQAMIYCLEKGKAIYNDLTSILMSYAKKGWVETFIIFAVTTMTLYGTPNIWGYGLGYNGIPAFQSYTGAALTLGTTAYLYEYVFNPDGSYIDIVNKGASAVYKGAELAASGAKIGFGIASSLGVVLTILALGGVVYVGYKVYGKSKGYADSKVDVNILNK